MEKIKVSLFSDLHLELETDRKYKAGLWQPPETDSSIIVLAGDIHNKHRAFQWIINHFKGKTVLYVPGNHEAYGNNMESVENHAKQWEIKARAQGVNLHWLNRKTWTNEEQGIRCIGATLWSDYKIMGQAEIVKTIALKKMNDFHKVRLGGKEGYKKIRPHHVEQWHHQDRLFIEQELKKPFNGVTCVITHHAPTLKSVEEHHIQRKDPLIGCYASALDELLHDHQVVWMHGHIHRSLGLNVGQSQIITNPRGYAPDHLNEHFNPQGQMLIDPCQKKIESWWMGVWSDEVEDQGTMTSSPPQHKIEESNMTNEKRGIKP